MKIICNQNEFAALVRECCHAAKNGCEGCLFDKVCTGGYDRNDDAYVMDRIEDICQIEVSDG